MTTTFFSTATSFFGLSLLTGNSGFAVVGMGFLVAGLIVLGYDAYRVLSR